MFLIEYFFSSNKDFDVLEVDEMSLSYDLFLGSLRLKAGDHSIKFDWNWIPLLDFAICLLYIRNDLYDNSQGKGLFTFTEAEYGIIFERKDDIVKVISDFSDESFEITFEEFDLGVIKYHQSVFADAYTQKPELKNSEVFMRFMNEVPTIG